LKRAVRGDPKRQRISRNQALYSLGGSFRLIVCASLQRTVGLADPGLADQRQRDPDGQDGCG